jgi:catechol 2,3-dioxygenase-like lactoylglutathione lyase family enzyme
MIRISRLAHVVFETPDLAQQVDHYTKVLGLQVTDRDATTAYLSCSTDHHTVVLKQGSTQQCTAIGFQVPIGSDLNAYAAQMQAHGIRTERQSHCQPAIADLVSFVDNKGTRIEVFAEALPSGLGFSRSGISPNKIGHVAFNVVDAPATVKFYCDVLGFKVSDWMGDFFAFLRCGLDHHSINLVAGQKSKMHHIAFELRDWTHIRDSSDMLAMDRIPLVWGPVRHGIGHNISTYHRSCDGHIVELFCELDRIHDEGLGHYEPRRVHQTYPQKPNIWEDIGLAANMWGTPPPDGFLD